MPLVALTGLPSFAHLKRKGELVLQPNQAVKQDIREQHIGLLNMMPDAALEVTERQFLSLIGQSNEIVQFHTHLFTIPTLPRNDKAKKHIAQYYETFDQIKETGLDALIISGANVTRENLTEEPFWQPLGEVIDWAYDNVTSTLCSCLATHAVMELRYQQKRKRLDSKCWGVFDHHVTDRTHPLVRNINTRFQVPHSRFNEVNYQQFKENKLKVLVKSSQAGVHMATSPDGFRLILFQGHPEYDNISLLKEYKREIMRYQNNESTDYPPFPSNYFDLQSQAIFQEYRQRMENAQKGHNKHNPLPDFPETIVAKKIHNAWSDTTKSIFSNWTGLVYQLTNVDRRIAFMDGIDPNEPLKDLY